MTAIESSVVLPHLMSRDKYGDQIESLAINSYIVIEPEDRQRVLHFIRKKYKKPSIPKDDQRIYRTSTSTGDNGASELRLFRLK